MSEHKGLGKGLDAFFFDNFDDLDKEMAEEVVYLPLDELHPNPYQPRRYFDETALNELAESIKHNGVFQPIIVRASAIKGYDIIAGERRVRASRLAGMTDIPAIVRTLTEEEMMQIAVIENLQREDLTPLEEAESYRTLMDELHLTQQELATRLGKSRPYIANYLRLLSLPEEIKTWVRDEKLSVGHARALLSLKSDQDKIAMAKKVIAEQLTVRDLEKQLSAKEGTMAVKKTATPSTKTKDRFVKESERQLTETLDAKVTIHSQGKKGKIEIHYQDLDELNRLLEFFNIDLD